MTLLTMNSLYNEKGQWPVPIYGTPEKTLTSCAARIIIFQKEHLNHSLVCFTQGNFFFQYVWFLVPICLPCVICGTYVTRINFMSWHDRAADILVASLGLFTSLVYVRRYCVPIATLNQSKRSRLLYLGDAKITSLSRLQKHRFKKVAKFAFFQKG